MSPPEIVIPWRNGCKHRAEALAYVHRHWRGNFPEWPLTVAEPPAGPWVKALAVMPAIWRSKADTIIVADADVWCSDVGWSVEQIDAGATWSIPHSIVLRLNRAATEAVYTGAPLGTAPPGMLEEMPYRGVATGGLVVIRREVALDVPLDARFEGWGGEDHSWGFSLDTLYGHSIRGDAVLYHLWHPPAERLTRRVGSEISEVLRLRYRAAMSNPDEMRRIVAEVPRPWDS